MIKALSALFITQVNPDIGAVENIVDAFQTHGWLGGLALTLMVGIQLIKKPAVQNFLPASLQWSNWSKGLKTVVAALLGTAGALVFTVGVMGTPLSVAVVLKALAVGVGASGVKKAVSSPKP